MRRRKEVYLQSSLLQGLARNKVSEEEQNLTGVLLDERREKGA